MKIKINEVDITSMVLENSLELNFYGAYRSEMSFSMEILDYNTNTLLPEILAGMQVRLYDDSDSLLWGGILENCMFIHRSKALTGVNLVCRGYEQILSHIALPPTTLNADNIGQVARNFCQNYLAQEGILYSSSNFDFLGDSVNFQTEKYKRFSSVFDDICYSYSYRWWIDRNRYFHFKTLSEVNITNYYIDLDDEDTGAKLLNFSLVKKIGDYRNRQIVTGKDGIYSIAENTEEIDNMSERFGSGVYCSVMENNRVLTANQASELAGGILSCYDREVAVITFTTTDNGIKMFDRIHLRGSKYDIGTFSNYVVTSITSKRVNGKFLHKITAKCSDAIAVRPEETWTSLLGKYYN